MFTVAIMAAGYSSYKTISSYRAINVSESDLLISENIEALSSGGEAYDSDDDDKPKKKKKIKVPKDSGICYINEWTKVRPVRDMYGRRIRDEYYWTYRALYNDFWQTCKKEWTEDEDAQDQCETRECQEGERTHVTPGWY